MTEKIQTICGKSISKSNISKHRKRCDRCGFNNVKTILESYEKRLECLEKQPKTVINVLNIIPFSQEPSLTKEVVKNLLEPVDESVPRYVKLKHFEQAGGNIRIPNKCQKRIQIFTEENGKSNWITKDRDDFIKDLTGLSMIELDTKYGASSMSEKWKMWAKTFINGDKDMQQRVDNAVMYTIMDNQ
tara:strand:+ start:3553 stop:4113 length:561 start_codon:yes stop_codon:yes gene_type:complete